MRTSYAAGHPQVRWRDGYRVIRKAGRYLVFPRAAFSEMMGWHGGRDGLVEIWNGMPFFSPLWARTAHVTWLHHVHAEMWEMTLPPRLAAFGNSSSRSSRRRSTAARRSSRSRSRRSTSSSTTSASSADRVSVVPPGHRPAVHARRREVADAARRRGRPARPGEAVRPAHRRAGRAEAAPPRPRGGDRGRGLRARASSRRRSTPLGAESWITLPGRVDDDEHGRPLPAGVGAGERVGARGLGHDDHRGRRVRHARGRDATSPATPTRSSTAHRAPRRRTATRCAPGSTGCSATTTSARRMSAARPRARGAVHVGGDRTRHARGARRRPRSRAAGRGTADEVHRHRAQLPAHRDERAHDPRRPVAARLVLLAVVVALPDGGRAVARGARARLRVPHAPPLRSLPLPVDAAHRPRRARARAEVRRPDPRRGGAQPRLRRGDGAPARAGRAARAGGAGRVVPERPRRLGVRGRRRRARARRHQRRQDPRPHAAQASSRSSAARRSCSRATRSRRPTRCSTPPTIPPTSS